MQIVFIMPLQVFAPSTTCTPQNPQLKRAKTLNKGFRNLTPQQVFRPVAERFWYT